MARKIGDVSIRVVTDMKKERESRKEFWDTIEKGRTIKSKPRELVLTPKTFSKVFSPERVRMILTVRNKKLHSISELARELARPFESVDRDVKYLEGLGLITLKKYERVRVPEVGESIKLRI